MCIRDRRGEEGGRQQLGDPGGPRERLQRPWLRAAGRDREAHPVRGVRVGGPGRRRSRPPLGDLDLRRLEADDGHGADGDGRGAPPLRRHGRGGRLRLGGRRAPMALRGHRLRLLLAALTIPRMPPGAVSYTHLTLPTICSV
eukprot:4005110-Alexandrium_andersonii.AAC.1